MSIKQVRDLFEKGSSFNSLVALLRTRSTVAESLSSKLFSEYCALDIEEISVFLDELTSAYHDCMSYTCKMKDELEDELKRQDIARKLAETAEYAIDPTFKESLRTEMLAAVAPGLLDEDEDHGTK